MYMHCFYCKNLNEQCADLYETEQKHLFSVLRAKENSKILLIDGKGGIAEGQIGKGKSVFLLSFKQLLPSQTKIHLYLSPPRKQKMDLLLTQCTEVGVWEIHPMFTEHSIALPQKETTVDRWRLKLIEACKQSHNPFVPKIYPPTTLKNAIKDIARSNLTAFFGSTGYNTNTIINKQPHNKLEVAWLVGPEGGFTNNEIELMINAGFQELSIGRWIMRVETAAVVGTALLQKL